MSGDSKIGPVGGIGRAGPLRRVASEATPMRATAQLQPAQESMPTARLSRLSAALAGQPPPVDIARVATLRTAIANGGYGVHSAIVASAMIDFHSRGTE